MASGKQPITRHPLFPATVALWFGALFGVGSLAVRPALIEAAIVSLRLDAIITVPMSSTTRILIALALAGVGGLLGAKLARRIGRPKTIVRPRKRGAHFTADGTEEATATPDVRTSRRSQLAIPDHAHGEMEYYDRAPVPGNTPILNVSQFGIEGFEPEKEAAASADAESSAETAFLPGPAYDEPPKAATPLETCDTAAEPVDEDFAADTVLPRLAGDAGDAGDDEPEIAAEAGIAPRLFNRPPTSGLFAQPFNANVAGIRWQDGDAPADSQSDPERQGDFHSDAAPKGDASAAERIVSARLDDLAPIELLERLAISLREKRTRAALTASGHPGASSPIAQASSDDDHPIAESPLNESTKPDLEDKADEPEAEELASTPAAPVTPPVPTIPAALRPIGLDPEDDEDVVPGYIPPRRIGGGMQSYSAPNATSSAGETGELEAADASDLEEGYSSLLNLSRHASQAQPADDASDPAPESATDGSSGSPDCPTDREETGHALRSALANIQRMSGAA